MPRKILNDNYILSECPQYQPLGVPNALLPQVDKPPKLQGFKNVVPARPTSISATISDLANNIYTPTPLNTQEKTENLMKAQVRIAQQMAVEVDPLAQDDVNELRAIALSLQSDIEEGIIRGDEELKEVLRLTAQEERAKVKVEELEKQMGEIVPKIRMSKDKMDKLRKAIRKSKMPIEQTILQRLNIPAPTKEQLIKGLGRRIPIEEVDIASPAEERVRMALEDMPIPRSIKRKTITGKRIPIEEVDIATPAEERVRMALEDIQIPRSVRDPVFEKNIQEMERKVILQKEQYLLEDPQFLQKEQYLLEDDPEKEFSIEQTYEEFLKEDEEREKIEREREDEYISDEISHIMDLAKRGEIKEERMNVLIKDLEEVRKFGRPEEKPEEPEPPVEMAGDRLAPRQVIKTKEIEVRPASLQRLQRETFLQTRGVAEAEVKPELAIKLPRRVGLRGSMRGELR